MPGPLWLDPMFVDPLDLVLAATHASALVVLTFIMIELHLLRSHIWKHWHIKSN